MENDSKVSLLSIENGEWIMIMRVLSAENGKWRTKDSIDYGENDECGMNSKCNFSQLRMENGE